MKIRKLQLKNIGVFDDETIEFQPCPAKDKAEIHIFTGQNGSGKTTILTALTSAFDDFGISEENRQRNLINKRFKDFDSIITIEFDLAKVAIYKSRMINSPKSLSKTHYDSDFRSYEDSLKSSRLYSYDYAVFAFSGYRQIQSEQIEAIKEPKDFNPLSQSLEFIKDYSQKNQLTINQLIANNISKSAIEKGRNEEKSKKFANVLKSIEEAISEITDWKIEFDLETEPTNLITKVNGEELDFDVLPDGLRSLISWIADLLGRIDLLKWQDDLPIFEKNLILFLDEIEVHLHPAWQRKVLPVVQKLFKNSQIFVSTHSPFVVNSVDDAWVYKLELENGKAKVAEIIKSEDGVSYSYVLSEIFDIKEEFGVEVQKDLAKFKELRNKILAGKNGSAKTQKEFLQLAKSLAVQSEELQTIVQFELRQINKRTGKNLTI